MKKNKKSNEEKFEFVSIEGHTEKKTNSKKNEEHNKDKKVEVKKNSEAKAKEVEKKSTTIDTVKNEKKKDVEKSTKSTEKNENKKEIKQKKDIYSESNSNINNKVYIGFELRVLFMLVLILTLFGLGCGFIFQAVSYGEDVVIGYNENSKVNYRVCVKQNNDYEESCLEEGDINRYISQLTTSIPITFNYDVNMSQNSKYNIDYYVDGVLKIVDNEDANKVLYTKTYKLVDIANINSSGDKIHFDKSLNLNFEKYNNYVTQYKSRYSLNADASFEVALYVSYNGKLNKVSSISLPLGEQTFSIQKDEINNNNKNVVVEKEEWNSVNTICLIIGGLAILCSVIFIIKLTSLVLKANKKSKYQRKLEQVLREYDRVIVIANNGYDSSKFETVLKLDNFNELLDARDTLDKPIIYVKVNSVKSEFYVEDVDKVYKYTMKEADFQ